MEGTCLVADLGTGSIKAELAGAETPKVFANCTGKVKHSSLLPQSLPGIIDDNLFVGNDVEKHRGLLKLSYPMEHGHVQDWKGLTHVLRQVNTSLGVPSKDHPILVTEAPIASRVQRNKMAQILFEEFQHPALLFSVQAVLSLYSSGQTTGVVLDIGDGVTHACPVFEGYSIREATRRVDFGGRDVTAYLQNLLRQNGVFLDTSAEFEVVKQIKEQRCEVAPTTRKELDSNAATKIKHRLPDGSEVSLGAELQLAPELLFNPSLFGFENPSVVQIVCEAVRKCDLDVRAQLYEQIQLAGGSTLFPKFGERFLSESVKMIPRQCKVRLCAPSDRQLTTWMGGSFLAQLSSFKEMLTKKSEYEEHGERILHNRLFA